jgi:hypothetical protein
MVEMTEDEFKLTKVLLALHGEKLIEEYRSCPYKGSGGYGKYPSVKKVPHGEPGDRIFKMPDNKTCIIPCKNHAKYYENDGASKEIEL